MHKIPELDKKGLREFAFVTGGILALIFGVFLPWILDRSYPYWPWIVLGILSGWGLLAPVSLRPVYIVWMKFALLLGRVTTPVILGVVFVTLFFPAALIFRMLGKDPMNRKFDKSKRTYRIEPDKVDHDNLEKPF
jgi:predicted membrane protein